MSFVSYQLTWVDVFGYLLANYLQFSTVVFSSAQSAIGFCLLYYSVPSTAHRVCRFHRGEWSGLGATGAFRFGRLFSCRTSFRIHQFFQPSACLVVFLVSPRIVDGESGVPIVFASSASMPHLAGVGDLADSVQQVIVVPASSVSA